MQQPCPAVLLSSQNPEARAFLLGLQVLREASHQVIPPFDVYRIMSKQQRVDSLKAIREFCKYVTELKETGNYTRLQIVVAYLEIYAKPETSVADFISKIPLRVKYSYMKNLPPLFDCNRKRPLCTPP